MWLGLDLGTGSLKAQLFGAEGEVLGEGRAACVVDAPREGWAESDPAVWWEALVSAVCTATDGYRDDVRAVGLSGQMHGVVLAEAQGAPLRPAVLWADTRSKAQLGGYRALSIKQRQSLANPLVVGMAGPTLLWLRDRESEVYRRARWALQPKDWLRLWLTGEVQSEPSDASGTLLYDLLEDSWAYDVMESLGLGPDLLAPLAPSASVTGTLRPEAAKALGLKSGLPVAAGAADTAAAIHGSDLAVGQAQLTVGSGAQLVVLTDIPKGAPEHGLHLFRTAGEGRYQLAAVQNAGLALEWVRVVLGLSWPEMYEALGATPPGCHGLTFLPYLTGERTPHLDPAARGGWHGASQQHTRDHLARAAFEGVAFAITDAAAALRKTGLDLEQLRLAGGGTREPAWRQLLADTLGAQLHPVTLPDASVRGAARLAAQALGEEMVFEPIYDAPVEPRRVAALEDAYKRFKGLYRRLA